MKPLFVLLSTFVISLLVIKFTKSQFDYALAGRIGMAAMLAFTAIGHFAFSEGMAAMVPGFIPAKITVVYLSGALEIVMAIGLLLPHYKTAVGWAVIIFFILVLPANIKAAIDHLDYQTGKLDGPGLQYLWFRVPLQLFFILWVFFFAVKH